MPITAVNPIEVSPKIIKSIKIQSALKKKESYMLNTFGSEKFKEQQRKINSSSIDPKGCNKQNSCALTILLKSFNMRLVCSKGIDYNVCDCYNTFWFVLE